MSEAGGVPGAPGGGASRSTRPAAGTSAATDVSLREYVDLQIQRVEEALAAEVELRRARRQDDLMAIEKAEQAVEKRLEGMNEFRQQLNDQASTFATREQLDAVKELAAEALPRSVFDAALQEWTVWRSGVDEFRNLTAGRASGVRLSTAAIVGGLSALTAIITIVIVLANVLTGK